MLSISMAVLPEPDTQVVMWPLLAEPITMISPALTMDCQLPDCLLPSKATNHSPLACPLTPTMELSTGSEAPASSAMVLASTQQPSIFQALPTNVCATAAIELGVAWLGMAPVKP